jgi:hypothetical protein
LSDQRNLVAVTQAINGGQNGAADRKKRYDRALALGDQLMVLATGAPPSPTPGEGFLMALSEAEQRQLFNTVCGPRPSRSPFRHLGEGNIGDLGDAVFNTDGSTHVEVVALLAGYGHPPSLALLREIASADPVKYPDRQGDRELAQATLAEVTAAPAATTVVHRTVTAAPAYVEPVVDQVMANRLADAYAEIARLRDENTMLRLDVATRETPSTELVVSNGQISETATTGETIGRAYDALEALRLADALPIESRAPLNALIAVLQTKNGADL